MLVYVDLEHAQLYEIDPELWHRSRANLLRNKYRFERLAARPCLIVRYDNVTPDFIRAVGAEAVLISGYYLDNSYYAAENLAGLMALYRQWTRPLIGFCGAHQLLAKAYGADIGPIAPIPPGVTQLHLATMQNITGVEQEIGFQPVTVQPSHPLFHHLDEMPTFFQAHYWEVKTAPDGFEVLATSDHCAIQAIGHRERPLFGTQFHPEAYDDRFGDGRQLLENFFSLIR